METGTCPICSAEIQRLARYPRSICRECFSRENVKDASGNPVWFCNTHFPGLGFASLHTVDGTVVEKEEHICFVKGVKCYAEEAKFGGIVIEIYVDQDVEKY